MVLLIGEVYQFQALYNSGAKINLIQYNLVKEHKLIPLLKQWKPIVGFLDKHWIKLHSAHKLIVLVANMHNHTKVVGPQPFQAADFVGYNLILRYPQLAEVDLKICFKIGAFKQWNNKELKGRILLTSLKDILKDIVLGEIVYALYLKEYQI